MNRERKPGVPRSRDGSESGWEGLVVSFEPDSEAA